jgi:hypothetical protein
MTFPFDSLEQQKQNFIDESLSGYEKMLEQLQEAKELVASLYDDEWLELLDVMIENCEEVVVALLEAQGKYKYYH